MFGGCGVKEGRWRCVAVMVVAQGGRDIPSAARRGDGAGEFSFSFFVCRRRENRGLIFSPAFKNYEIWREMNFLLRLDSRYIK